MPFVPASEVLPAAAAVLAADVAQQVAAVGEVPQTLSVGHVAASISSAATERGSVDFDNDLEAPLLQGHNLLAGTVADANAVPAAYVVTPNGIRPVTPQDASAFAAAAAAGTTPPGTVVVPVVTREQAAALRSFQRQLSFAYGLSWLVNILLLVAKLYAYHISQSKAVLASAADSAVDLVSCL